MEFFTSKNLQKLQRAVNDFKPERAHRLLWYVNPNPLKVSRVWTRVHFVKAKWKTFLGFNLKRKLFSCRHAF